MSHSFGKPRYPCPRFSFLALGTKAGVVLLLQCHLPPPSPSSLPSPSLSFAAAVAVHPFGTYITCLAWAAVPGTEKQWRGRVGTPDEMEEEDRAVLVTGAVLC
jgi:hypothetical protein